MRSPDYKNRQEKSQCSFNARVQFKVGVSEGTHKGCPYGYSIRLRNWSVWVNRDLDCTRGGGLLADAGSGIEQWMFNFTALGSHAHGEITQLMGNFRGFGRSYAGGTGPRKIYAYVVFCWFRRACGD